MTLDAVVHRRGFGLVEDQGDRGTHRRRHGEQLGAITRSDPSDSISRVDTAERTRPGGRGFDFDDLQLETRWILPSLRPGCGMNSESHAGSGAMKDPEAELRTRLACYEDANLTRLDRAFSGGEGSPIALTLGVRTADPVILWRRLR